MANLNSGAQGQDNTGTSAAAEEQQAGDLEATAGDDSAGLADAIGAGAESGASDDEGGLSQMLSGDEGSEAEGEGQESSEDGGEDDGESDDFKFDLENADMSDMPEGFEFDPEMISEMEEFAREKKIPAAHAKDLLAMGVQMQAKMNAKQIELVTSYKKDLIKACRDDPEISGADGKQFKAAINSCARAIKAAPGGDGLAKKLSERGIIFADDPDFVKVMNHYGKMISEDKTPGGRPPKRSASDADVLFPNT